MTQRYQVPFVLASTAHGPLILHALDWKQGNDNSVELGVGLDLLIHGEFDLALISLTVGALQLRHRDHGPGVIAIDGGANIGVYSIEWARAMAHYGMVLSFEPQERMFYALAGNIALNNLFNVKALNKALGDRCEHGDMPAPDYRRPAQYGGLRLNGEGQIGQTIEATAPVEILTIDALELPRVDFIKLDIEGMEVAALQGARQTILKHKPYLLVEWTISGKADIESFLNSVGYDYTTIGMNMVAGPTGNEFVARCRTLPLEAA